MDRLRAIEYLIKVADLGSFTAAAKAVGVPASSISRRVRDLEEELGATLLHRTTRDVRLTELGALYLEHARPAVAGLDHARDLVVDQPSSPSGVLRISAIPGYGGVVLLPAIRKLRTKYPDLVVDLELTDQVVDIAKNEVDIAIRSTAKPPERVVAKKLVDNAFKLVASRDYVQRHGAPQSIEDVRTHKAVLHRGPTRAVHWQAKTDKGWVEVQPEAAFVSNIADELVSETIQGRGLALLPAWGIEQELAEGTLVDVTPKDTSMALTRSEHSAIYLLYNRPKYRLHKLKVAIEFLVSELRA